MDPYRMEIEARYRREESARAADTANLIHEARRVRERRSVADRLAVSWWAARGAVARTRCALAKRTCQA